MIFILASNLHVFSQSRGFEEIPACRESVQGCLLLFGGCWAVVCVSVSPGTVGSGMLLLIFQLLVFL